MPDPDPTSLDLAMMEQALRLAHRAGRRDEVPVGAVVYRGGNPIARAYNRRELDQDPTAHAEILVLRRAARRLGSWRLAGCAIAVTLEPCPMCAGALVNARIDRLVYGAHDPKAGCARTLARLCDDPRLNHRLAIVPGVAAERCGRLLTEFFRSRRKHPPERDGGGQPT